MSIFFCGIGGAGTLPLAQILSARGEQIIWSDRDHDRGVLPEKFAPLKARWPRWVPQDGSGITAHAAEITAVIPSGSVEAQIPDLDRAREQGLPIRKRPEVLAQLFHGARERVGIAGTSGKTTTTGLMGYLLQELRENPTVMCGGILRNYSAEDPYCMALTGRPELFVTEIDESDGSIDLFRPSVGILTNVTLDHKSLEELHDLFGRYLARCQRAVVNLDDVSVRSLSSRCRGEVIGFALDYPAARLTARDIRLKPDGVEARVVDQVKGGEYPLNLALPGRHNLSNALAALGAALALGLPLEKTVPVLAGFKGIARRMEVIGQQHGVTVIDDFAHNPDKIAASLSTLKAFPGRLKILFQPHGYGPVRLMRKELAQTFAAHLSPEDELHLPEPFYAGGTTDKSVGSRELVADIVALGGTAFYWPTREAALPALLKDVKAGDRLIIMGARDESLPAYAREVLNRLSMAA